MFVMTSCGYISIIIGVKSYGVKRSRRFYGTIRYIIEEKKEKKMTV